MMAYWSELARAVAVPRDGTPVTLVRAGRTRPPYVTDELLVTLDAALGPNLEVLQWDCDHMVPQARPAETAEVIRAHLERD
jgi:lipase